jgi:hypothetical protein
VKERDDLINVLRQAVTLADAEDLVDHFAHALAERVRDAGTAAPTVIAAKHVFQVADLIDSFRKGC